MVGTVKLLRLIRVVEDISFRSKIASYKGQFEDFKLSLTIFLSEHFLQILMRVTYQLEIKFLLKYVNYTI